MVQEKREAGREITVLIVSSGQFQYNNAPSSRAWHVSGELNNCGIKTIIVTRKATADSISGENIIAIKPILCRGFFGNLLFLFQISVAMLQHLFDSRVDYLIVRGCHLALTSILFKLWHKGIIYDFHGYAYKEEVVEGRKLRAKTTKPFDWLALRLAEHILVIREELKQSLPVNFQKKTILLPNGVDLEEFAAREDEGILDRYSIPQGKKLVGFVGNWEAWIAMEDLLASVKYLDTDVKLIVVGKGRKFEEYKVGYPSVLFTGRVPHRDAVELLRRMDICVLPYSHQPILKDTRKASEYLAAGKPIVVANTTERERYLVEGESALLYEAGNPEDLAEKVKYLLSNEELYARISRNNLELAKQFSWKEVIARSGLIELLLGS